MPDVNIRLVRTFLMLVEERSMAGAARRTRLSQPGVRAHLATAEKAVDERLIERRLLPARTDLGRMQLTKAGRAFLPKAVEAVWTHDSMFADAPSDRGLQEAMNPAIAAELPELTRGALRHDLWQAKTHPRHSDDLKSLYRSWAGHLDTRQGRFEADNCGGRDFPLHDPTDFAGSKRLQCVAGVIARRSFASERPYRDHEPWENCLATNAPLRKTLSCTTPAWRQMRRQSRPD